LEHYEAQTWSAEYHAAASSCTRVHGTSDAIAAEWEGDIRGALRDALPLIAGSSSAADADQRHHLLGCAIWDALQLEIEGGLGNTRPLLRVRDHGELARNLPKLFAFGHSLAQQCYRQVGDDPVAEANVCRLGALLNAAVCAIDRIWDVEYEGKSYVASLLTEQWITGALDPATWARRPRKCLLAADSRRAPTLAAFACRALDLYMDGVRDLYQRGAGSAEDLRSLAERMCEVLRAHRVSPGLRVDTSLPSQAVAATLRTVGTGPLQLIGLTALLACPFVNEALRDEMRDTTLALGDAFRCLDDAIDAFEDLDAGVWSSVWLSLAERGVELVDAVGRVRAADLLVELRRTHVAEAVATRVVNALAAYDQHHSGEMLSWVRSWGVA
jgi:hypothetical protein